MNNPYPSVTEFFRLGKVQKSHGTSGQVRLMTDPSLKVYVQRGAFLFIDIDGSKVPFKISDVDDSAHFVVSFEGVLNKRDSDRLTGFDLYIPLSGVKPRHQRSPRNVNAKWEEYQIENMGTQQRYDILRVEDFPQQLMAIVLVDGKETMIPLSDQLIHEIDKAGKIVRMQIPEGLFEL